MREVKSLIPEKLRASICHHCPFCRHARNHPESFVGKLIHSHHAKECKMWAAEQEVYGKEQ